MKRAYSIVRFSSWRQATGRSKSRQLKWSADWAKRHKYLLDDSLHCDRPVSAFRGANRSKGALANFLEMIQVGRVAKGSVLLVESLDRLSREEVDEALTLFLNILKAGVEIVTMTPERRYTKASVGDLVGLIEPLVIMSRAHEESLIKSKRLLDVWQERRKKASRDKPVNGRGPAWLHMVNGRWEVIEERAAIVRRVFALSIDGHGQHAIAHLLNQEKVPPMGWGKRWNIRYISLILRSRAVLGEYQPCEIREGKRTPIGEPIAGYYPAVIKEMLFYQAQAALDSRRNQRGPRGKFVRNLFTGLLRDARNHCTMITIAESGGRQTVKLVSSGAHLGEANADYRTFPYEVVEHYFLRLVKELKAGDILPRGKRNGEDEIAERAGRLQDIDHRIGRLMGNLKQSGDFDAGLRLLRDLQKEKEREARALEKAKAEHATSEVETLGETQSIIDLLANAAEEERLTLRLKLKQRIRELVAELWALVVPLHRGRVCVLQAWLKNGQQRTFAILYWQANRSHPGDSAVRSLATLAGPRVWDLRRRSEAQALEKFLTDAALPAAEE